jgi:hypothetical protein
MFLAFLERIEMTDSYDNWIKQQSPDLVSSAERLLEMFAESPRSRKSDDFEVKVLTLTDSTGTMEWIDENDEAFADEDDGVLPPHDKQVRSPNNTLEEADRDTARMSTMPLPPFSVIEQCLRCSICHDVFSNTIATKCCITRMCTACMKQMLSQITSQAKHPCPHCRAQITSLRSTRPDKRIDNLITVFRQNQGSNLNVAVNDLDSRDILRLAREAHKNRIEQFKSMSKLASGNGTHGMDDAKAMRMGKKTAKKKREKERLTQEAHQRGRAGYTRRGGADYYSSSEDRDQLDFGGNIKVPEVALRPPYTETVEKRVTYLLKPFLEVPCDTSEVHVYDTFAEVSSNLLPELQGGLRPVAVSSDLSGYTSDMMKTPTLLHEWRHVISRCIAVRELENRNMSSSSNLTVRKVRDWLAREKRKHDNAIASVTALGRVPKDVWGGLVKELGLSAANDDNNGSSSEAAATTVVVNAADIPSLFRFDFQLFVLVDDVPVVLEDQYVLCSMFSLPFLVCDVSISRLDI